MDSTTSPYFKSHSIIQDSQELHDPTDFPPATEAPGLRELDESLRCKICSEFYTAPMSLSCGHTFCSLCIRTHLTEKALCPICRQTSSDTHLRKNQELEDAVRAWITGRSFVLDLCKAQRESHRNSTAPIPNPETTPRPERRSSSKPTPRKRKRYAGSDDDSVELVGSQLQESRLDDKSPAEGRADDQPVVVDCPICTRSVPLDSINQHMDRGCAEPTIGESSAGRTSKVKQKRDWARVFSHTSESSAPSKSKGKEMVKVEHVEQESAEPLPKVSYHTLKERRIREMLMEYDLPTNGDKDALASRHQRWVVLFNANLDCIPGDRKPLEQLRQELKEWEKAQRTGKSHIITDVNAYQKANKGHFDALIAAARPRRKSRTKSGDTNQPHLHSVPPPGEDVDIADADDAS